MGLTAAMNYYFGDHARTPSAAEAIILIERLGSVRGNLNIPRFDEIVSQAVCEEILDRQDVTESIDLYEKLAANDKVLIGDRQRFEKLKLKWSKKAP